MSDLQLDLGTTDELRTDPDTENVTAGSPLISRASITPYLAVERAAEAIDWYRAAFGAQLRSDPIVMDDGRIGHAEIEIGGALIMLADEFPDIGHTAPTQDLGVHVSLHLTVANVDEVIDRAVAEGAALERPAADFEYGRSGTIRDPFGHRWQIMQEPALAVPVGGDAVSVPRHGDIGYVSLWLPDTDRGASFFSSVLGWEYAPPSEGRSRRVLGLGIHHGMWGGVEEPTLFCCFAVDDMAAATARVVQAGGTAGEPQMEPYGEVAECSDDQGVQFAMYVPPGGVRRSGGSADSGPPALGPQGEVAYVTMEVPDSERTRSFYGTVLGWRFEPGSVEDGWQVEDVAPMVGVSGGHARGRPRSRCTPLKTST